MFLAFAPGKVYAVHGLHALAWVDIDVINYITKYMTKIKAKLNFLL